MEATKKPTPIAIITKSSMVITLRGIERNRDPTDVGAAATNPEMARAFDLTRAFSRLGRVQFPDPSRGCRRIKCTPAH